MSASTPSRHAPSQTAIGPARVLRAGLLYFACVFGVGFVLGTLRVLLLVPHLGVRIAELMELPFMLLASYWVARQLVRRSALERGVQRLAMGMFALCLLIAAELGLALVLQGQDLAGYVASRDPVSGTAYLLSLLLFSLMPLLAGRPRAW